MEDLVSKISYEVQNVKKDEISIVKIIAPTVSDYSDIVDHLQNRIHLHNVLYIHVPIDSNGNTKEPSVDFIR